MSSVFQTLAQGHEVITQRGAIDGMVFTMLTPFCVSLKHYPHSSQFEPFG
jgi:hypothetical protein